MLSERYGEGAAAAKTNGKTLREKKASLDACTAQVSQSVEGRGHGVMRSWVLSLVCSIESTTSICSLLRVRRLPSQMITLYHSPGPPRAPPGRPVWLRPKIEICLLPASFFFTARVLP